MRTIGMNEKTIRKNPINPNLFTANQATCTNALGTTEGFYEYNGGIIESSVAQSCQGDRSLKCHTPGSLVNEGCNTSTRTVVNGETYKCLARILMPANAKFQIWIDGSSLNKSDTITGTGAWQEISFSAIAGSNTFTPYFVTSDLAQSIDFYLGKLIFRKGTY